MSQVQSCYVCGRQGVLVDQQILIHRGETPPLIGQCPRCHRYICPQHAEPIDRSGRKSWFSRQTGPLTLCCPFDPDVPLGRET